MAKEVLPTVTKVAQVLADDTGQAIHLDLEHADGIVRTIEIPVEWLPLLANGIKNAARLAEKVRRAQQGETDPNEYPINVRYVSSGVFEDGRVGLRILTAEGPPLPLAMTADWARQTIELLQKQLTDLSSAKPPTMRRH